MTGLQSSLARLQCHRADPEAVKREGWRRQGILVISVADSRLTWPERELVKQLGERLYGKVAGEDAMAAGESSD